MKIYIHLEQKKYTVNKYFQGGLTKTKKIINVRIKTRSASILVLCVDVESCCDGG